MSRPDRETLRRLRDDVALFAQHVIGEPLWAHQIALATDPARIRAVCSGRQAGKSRALQIMSLHEAFRLPKRQILLISAGEAAARDLLGEVAMLAAAAAALAGSVVDESTSMLRLSNGSVIQSVPASTKQVRGRSIDLLIIDEAAFVDDAIWSAARFTTIARPDSRIILASTPWGREDRFFALTHRAGLRGEPGYSSHHWPSTVSPLVDDTLLDMFRSTMTDREYRAEVLAEWVDGAGAYFAQADLDAAVALGGPEGSPLLDPAGCFFASCGRLEAAVGVDWGFANDASTAVAVAAVPSELPFAGPGRRFIPWLIERHGTPYEAFIDELVAAGSTDGLAFRSMHPETNGVGQMPSQVLRRRMTETWACRAVEGVATTAQTKADCFGAVTMALQSGSLVLPRHPELLRQMSNLEYEELDSGAMRIAVPDARGHDDLVMAASFAFLPTVAEANVAARGGEMVVFDYRTGAQVSGPDPEVDMRAAQLVRRWSAEGPASKPDGVSREAYARTVVRTMLYGPQERRSRR